MYILPQWKEKHRRLPLPPPPKRGHIKIWMIPRIQHCAGTPPTLHLTEGYSINGDYKFTEMIIKYIDTYCCICGSLPPPEPWNNNGQRRLLPLWLDTCFTNVQVSTLRKALCQELWKIWKWSIYKKFIVWKRVYPCIHFSMNNINTR